MNAATIRITAPDASGRSVTLDAGAVERSVAALADACRAHRTIAIAAVPTIETILAVLAVWRAGATLVPLNPDIGCDERAHVLRVSRPEAWLVPAVQPTVATDLPTIPIGVPAVSEPDGSPERVAQAATGQPVHSQTRDTSASDDAPALIIFTSGTTGPPKGAVLSFGAVRANIAGLAQAWRWTATDTLVQALPLFHVHGLVLGVLGPALLGGALVHVGRFDAPAIARALASGGTLLFGVPTMYRRLVQAAGGDPSIADALRRPRLLISGSAALARADAERLQALTGRRVLERYGLTETLIVCAARPDEAEAGVGPPVPGIDVRLVDEHGTIIDAADTLGEIEVRGPSLFSGYLDAPDATAAAYNGQWFRTGDTGLRRPDGTYQVAGRSSLDIIKTGGFKVGAGEIEAVLAEHPDVAEVAITGEADPDLGQRIVAWIVAVPGAMPEPAALTAFVAARLAPHKRPRVVHLVASLPRTPLGKVEKRRLVRP